jgi:transcriptional regulator with XRE-family HTH domain
VEAHFSPDRLRGHRHGSGRTLAELGAAVGRSAESIKFYETGRSRPPADILGRLAAALGICTDELFGRHADPVVEYVDAVAQHCPPLTAEEVQGAAVVLRTMRRARHSRAARQVPA